jgi:uncharacterized protein YdaU (DUF1376 family)
MNYFQFHIGDYAAATMHLSLIEDAVFQRLLRRYYLDEKPLPAAVKDCARLVGAKSPEELEAVEIVLGEFFVLTEAGWSNTRADTEIQAYRDKSNKAKASIEKRWNNERNTDVIRPNAERNSNQEPRTKNHKPVTKNTSAIAPPDGVTDSVWTDFVQLRRDKKAKLTQTAIDGIASEAGKAGWPLEDALRECCARGWTGFKADWVADKPGKRVENKQEALEARNRSVARAWATKNQEVVDA